jgi:bidirectional [NiFe] hydrogenase diaphorase subunit
MALPRRVTRAEVAVSADDPRLRMVDRALKRIQNRPDAVIEILHVAQENFGYLSSEVLAYIARALNLPESQVFGVATFYHFFTLRPKGEHSCIVCTGTACYVKGAGEIVAALEKAFDVKEGQTTADGKLHLGSARCLGSCSLAPMLTLDDRVLGKETPASTVRQVNAALAAGSPEGKSA